MIFELCYIEAIIENLGNPYFIGTSKILTCAYQILIKIYYSAEYTNLTVMYLPLNAFFSLYLVPGILPDVRPGL